MFELMIVIFLWVIGILVTSIWESVKNIDKILYDNYNKDVENSNTR